MTSTKQTAANRRNAKRSTGPRTASGKFGSRANALRHGLLSKALAGAEYNARTEELAKRIAREHGKPENSIEARTIAEADMAILKIRTLRAKLLNAIPTDDKAGESNRDSPDAVRVVPHASIRRAAEQSVVPSSYLNEIQQLLALDRYEQRAISRRRHALKQLCWLSRSTSSS
jgi:hypothetical protein